VIEQIAPGHYDSSMHSDRDSKIREGYRQASLEDALMDFIHSVDESEAFEGYGARFNAKCVESVTSALNRHCDALRDHQESVQEVRVTLANIQKMLMLLTLCAVAMVVMLFINRPHANSPTASTQSPDSGIPESAANPPDGIENARANSAIAIGSQSDPVKEADTNVIQTGPIHTPANDPLLQPIDVTQRIKSISGRAAAALEKQIVAPIPSENNFSQAPTGASQPANAAEIPKDQVQRPAPSAITGESLFDRWK
jgi:hypothetical protein